MTTIEDRLAEYAALSREIALACDADGRVVWRDARAARILAIEPGIAFTSLAAPGNDTKVSLFLEAARAAPTPAWELVLVASGEPVAVACQGAPLDDGVLVIGSLVPEDYRSLAEQVSAAANELSVLHRETQRQSRMLGQAHAEIRQLLSAEQAARVDADLERARLLQVINRLPEGVLIADANGILIVANVVAENVLGLELAGHRFDIAHNGSIGVMRADGSPVPFGESPLERAVLRGDEVRGEQVVVRAASGQRDVPLLVNSAPLVDAAGERAGAVVVFQDISAIRNLENQKDEFLGTVSHDLKNPLSGIKGWVQILIRRARTLSDPDQREKWQQDLQTIDRTTTRMANMLDELVDLTQVRMGGALTLHREWVDLVGLVHRVVAENTAAATHHRLIVVAERETISGFWDRARIERVVSNLIGNAIKYSPRGGEVTARLSVAPTPDGDDAVLSVTDQGIGILAADLPRVFDRFFRGANVGPRISGTGVGLAGVRQLVELHGGTIDVRSEPDAGSTFTVRLPLRSGQPLLPDSQIER